MHHRLYIIEGLPCSGKSTTSAYVAELLEQQGNVCYVDEGSGDHPADYEFHALAPVEILILENPQRDWKNARKTAQRYIEDQKYAEIKTV